MELINKDDYEVIKKEDKKVSADEEPLSLIPEEQLEKYQAFFANVNLTDGYYTMQVVPS